jgi:hypothetical protein
MKQPLPPLEKNAYDGEKYDAPIPRDTPIKNCTHKQIELISRELKCPCGVGYTGFGVEALLKAFKAQ